MNKGDWLQLLIIILVFIVLAFIIYSLISFSWWVVLVELLVVGIGAYFINSRIRL